MNKFDSTLLPQTNDKEEIQKGNLDLLAKINATILFMQEGIVTFAQEILKVLSTYIFPASRVSFAPGNSGLAATEVQTMGTELANPVNTKATIDDADTVTGNDTADGGKVKKWTWATVKAWAKTFTWNSTTDGNGGQQPAPTPTSGVPVGGADGPGQQLAGTTIGVATYSYAGPIAKGSGTIWRFNCITIVTATAALVPGKTSLGLIGAGSAGIFSSLATETVIWDAVRVK